MLSPAEAKRLAPHQPDLGVALNCAKLGASAAATMCTTLAFCFCPSSPSPLPSLSLLFKGTAACSPAFCFRRLTMLLTVSGVAAALAGLEALLCVLPVVSFAVLLSFFVLLVGSGSTSSSAAAFLFIFLQESVLASLSSLTVPVPLTFPYAQHAGHYRKST